MMKIAIAMMIKITDKPVMNDQTVWRVSRIP